MKRLCAVGIICILCLSACSRSKSEVIQPSEQQATATPTFSPTPTVTPTPTPSVTATLSPSPTSTPTPKIDITEINDDDWYYLQYLLPMNGYDQVILVTINDGKAIVSFYLAYVDGEWVVLSKVYG